MCVSIIIKRFNQSITLSFPCQNISICPEIQYHLKICNFLRLSRIFLYTRHRTFPSSHQSYSFSTIISSFTEIRIESLRKRQRDKGGQTVIGGPTNRQMEGQTDKFQCGKKTDRKGRLKDTCTDTYRHAYTHIHTHKSTDM